MATEQYAPYGYLTLGSSALTNPTEFTFAGESGAAFQKTLTGSTGFTNGIPEINISASGAVNKIATQTKQLLAAWLGQLPVTLRFRVADMIGVSEGRITSVEIKSQVGNNVVFDFKFHGSIAPGAIQDA